MRSTCHTLVLVLTLLLTACSGDELVGVHIKLEQDGKGTLTTRALTTPDPGRAEAATKGATFTARASLVASQGQFIRLDDVKLGGANGLRFAAKLGDDQPSVRVYVPRGPEQQWIQALVPDRETRHKMAEVYDPTGKTLEVGNMIRIEIELPGAVVASSVHPAGRGIEADRERKRAFLLLPARSVTEEGEELVWDITWR
ncbi:MAG: hypothetical protein NXI31_23570 [bacterium]|nr:hypothetical protein [bacterium]